HAIRIIEAGAELFEEISQTAVAMRLHDGDDPAFARLPGGAQDGTYLHWMVRVVVDDGDAAGLPGLGETPLYPLEGLQRLAQRLLAQAHLDRQGADHERVLDVVLSHHPQEEILDARALSVPAVDHQVKARAAVFQPQVLGGDIRLRTDR